MTVIERLRLLLAVHSSYISGVVSCRRWEDPVRSSCRLCVTRPLNSTLSIHGDLALPNLSPSLSRLRRLAVAALVSLFAVVSPASALTADEQAALERASQYVNGLSAITGRFTQTGPDGRQIGGTYYIERPGKIRFDYDKPSTLQIIGDGRFVAVRNIKKNTHDSYPLGRTPLRFLVSPDVNLARDAQVLGVFEDSDRTTLVLADSQSGDGRLSLTFNGPDFQLQQWTVTDAQGLDTTVVLNSMEAGTGLPDKLFRIPRIQN